MKKTILMLGVFYFVLSLNVAMANDQERQILEKALVEEAVTKEQKTAVANYFKGIAAEKRKLAKTLEDEAVTSHGGKVSAESKRTESLKKRAKDLKSLADSYEKKAADIVK